MLRFTNKLGSSAVRGNGFMDEQKNNNNIKDSFHFVSSACQIHQFKYLEFSTKVKD